MKIAKFILFIPLFILCFGCANKSKPDNESQFKKDEKAIQNYIKKNNIKAKKDTTYGIYYSITKQGKGNFPKATDQVTVSYKGYTLNGKIFDKSDKSGITFNLQSVIPGWRVGIPYFKEGGSGTLYIPSGLAYGTKGMGKVKPNEVLIFDVKLLNIAD